VERPTGQDPPFLQPPHRHLPSSPPAEGVPGAGFAEFKGLFWAVRDDLTPDQREAVVHRWADSPRVQCQPLPESPGENVRALRI